ncbi:hypothetical protein DYQ86_17180 [Acidobacteria bacterium AB60]|nr:hypothetical protein DYQ86_17180 [Acidobacteria bacterium AB60]
MHHPMMKSLSRIVLATALAGISSGLTAQDAPKPAAKATVSADSPSRWDIFAGYSYLAPKGTINVLQYDGVTVLPETFKSMDAGVIGSVARYFNKYVGLQAEGSTHDTMKNSSSSNGGISTIQGGLIFRFPTEEITPFVHGLAGGSYVGGPEHEPYKWGPSLTAGGGMDYETPFFNHHLAIRLFQADYQYMHVNWGPGVFGGRANLKVARLSTGIVYHIGTIAPPPQLTVACSANPTSVFPGDPVNLTATAGSQDPKLNVIYGWSGDGVKGNGANATVDTSSLSPGTHTVKCDAKEGKPGKEGLKPWQVAQQGTATFTVKEFEPPTISCSVSPTTLKPGDSATITAQGLSPQNRPLTYTYSASAGTVNGSGNSASYSSTGAPTGPVSITCNVADDKGHSASSNANLTIEAPPPPPQPHTQALCSISFTNDKKRPMRVDNEAKACLDEVALDLQRQTDAKAVIVGESNAKEKAAQEKAEKLNARRKHAKPVENPAAQRAVNTKQYLVTDKGIDPSRITVATGSGDDQKVENYLVPSGANFGSDVQGTTPVDESAVKPQERKALPQRHHGRAKK